MRPHRDRYGYHALASGGIGLPATALAVAGDGSSRMYSIQSLWTAANHKLPLTFVIVNNGGSQGLAALSTRNWAAKRKALVEQISKASQTSPIDPDWLALQVVEAMPDNAILVDEGLTSSRQIIGLRPHRDRYGYHALASGGIGWGLPAAVGVSLANPQRPVVCYSGDGSSMYSIQSLWTAANHKLPLTFVIVNNGGYRIIKQRLLAFHGDDHYVGMDFIDPPVDFTALARSLGLEAIRITDPQELKGAMKSAFSRPGAKLIEVVVSNSVN
ncbi:thiamine pyrophosphate-dependent acetolactate synthase large subunit-like protein [Bradyrhizobium elkanii]